MSYFRPGGFEMTKRAIERCALPENAIVLDVGCGDGSCVERLCSEMHYQAKGIDPSKELIEKAKQRNPQLDVRRMVGCELPYEIRSFDAVLMECSLSVMDMQIEALHEAYCVLKNGGWLIISDVYLLHPDHKRANEAREAAVAESHRKRQHGECSEEKQTPSPICLDGAIVKPFLLYELNELGFDVVYYGDETPALQTWAAELVMKYGSFEDYCKQEGSCDTCFSRITDQRNTGYFVLLAKKK